MRGRAAEPESCASTQGNLRGGRSPHTSWLPRADLGCLPIVRLSGSTPGPGAAWGVCVSLGIQLSLRACKKLLFKTPPVTVSSSKLPHGHKWHPHHQGLSLGPPLTVAPLHWKDLSSHHIQSAAPLHGCFLSFKSASCRRSLCLHTSL